MEIIPLSNPCVSFPTSATLAGQGDTVAAAIARWAMPFPPVPAHTALRTVPRAAILHDLAPTERVPIGLVTLAAAVGSDELL